MLRKILGCAWFATIAASIVSTASAQGYGECDKGVSYDTAHTYVTVEAAATTLEYGGGDYQSDCIYELNGLPLSTLKTANDETDYGVANVEISAEAHVEEYGSLSVSGTANGKPYRNISSTGRYSAHSRFGNILTIRVDWSKLDDDYINLPADIRCSSTEFFSRTPICSIGMAHKSFGVLFDYKSPSRATDNFFDITEQQDLRLSKEQFENGEIQFLVYSEVAVGLTVNLVEGKIFADNLKSSLSFSDLPPSVSCTSQSGLFPGCDDAKPPGINLWAFSGDPDQPAKSGIDYTIYEPVGERSGRVNADTTENALESVQYMLASFNVVLLICRFQ